VLAPYVSVVLTVIDHKQGAIVVSSLSSEVGGKISKEMNDLFNKDGSICHIFCQTKIPLSPFLFISLKTISSDLLLLFVNRS
jgi:hypothetical protein